MHVQAVDLTGFLSGDMAIGCGTGDSILYCLLWGIIWDSFVLVSLEIGSSIIHRLNECTLSKRLSGIIDQTTSAWLFSNELVKCESKLFLPLLIFQVLQSRVSRDLYQM